MKKINVIITGASGMIGSSVLDQCLHHNAIGKVLTINRRALGIRHPKLKEVCLASLEQVDTVNDILKNYDACFYCAGVSSLGMDEKQYFEQTYSLTMNFATYLSGINPNMTFCYVSGAGTDSTEKSKTMWARVKGKTENDLMQLPFRQVYNFRPGGLIPYLEITPNQTYQSVKYIKWLLIILRPVFPNYIMKLERFSLGMINSVLYGYPQKVLEVKNIRKLSVISRS